VEASETKRKSRFGEDEEAKNGSITARRVEERILVAVVTVSVMWEEEKKLGEMN
jgi:hypothetical protein